MLKRVLGLTILLWSMGTGFGYAQQCLHGPNETADQVARRRDALGATRLIITLQASRPASAGRRYLNHSELSSAPDAARMRESTIEQIRQISLDPNTDILPGWRLTLDVSEGGYWLMIKDTTDPCGFAYISNQTGLILRAEPIR